MTVTQGLLLVVSGFAAGVVNAVAAGSALVSFPALVSVGLSPLVANATSAVALVPGSVAVAINYRHEMRSFREELPLFVLISVAGGLVGGAILLAIGNQGFERAVPWLIAGATVCLASKDLIDKIRKSSPVPSRTKKTLGLFALVIVSIYGGFFGAGMGFLLMATLTAMEPADFHKSNAIKNIMGVLSQVAAIGLFIFAGLVSWPHALLLMIGAGVGGYAGVGFARFVPDVYLRVVMIAFGSIVSVLFFLR